MNNVYFNRLSQKIKAYIRFKDPNAPGFNVDGGFSNSYYDSNEDMDGGIASTIFDLEVSDGGTSNAVFTSEIDGLFAANVGEYEEIDGGIAHDGNADDSDEYNYIYSSTDLQEIEINDNIERLLRQLKSNY